MRRWCFYVMAVGLTCLGVFLIASEGLIKTPYWSPVLSLVGRVGALAGLAATVVGAIGALIVYTRTRTKMPSQPCVYLLIYAAMIIIVWLMVAMIRPETLETVSLLLRLMIVVSVVMAAGVLIVRELRSIPQ